MKAKKSKPDAPANSPASPSWRKGEPIRAPRTAKNISEAMKHRFGFDQEVNPEFKGFLVQALWPRTDSLQSDGEFSEKLDLFEKILDQIRVEWTRTAETKP